MAHDLHEVYVKECTGKCNKQTRAKIAPNDICTLLESNTDGLPVRCVGSWSKQKIHYLLQYFGIFSAAMHKKWDNNINYVEICCGTGRCIARDLKIEFDGTALGILNHKNFEHISNAIFVDFDSTTLSILSERLAKHELTNYHLLEGDYNKAEALIENLSRSIDIRTGLTLFFIDPTDCSVPFNLISKIKDSFPNSDFIINLAIGTDFTRNVAGSINNPESYFKVRNKYMRFLGAKDFFLDERVSELAIQKNTKSLRTIFREYYVQSLSNIGLDYTDFIRVVPYYDIVFASQHELGLKFWKEASKYEHDGQKKLDLFN